MVCGFKNLLKEETVKSLMSTVAMESGTRQRAAYGVARSVFSQYFAKACHTELMIQKHGPVITDATVSSE